MTKYNLIPCENCDYFAKWDDKFCKNCRDLEQKGEISFESN